MEVQAADFQEVVEDKRKDMGSLEAVSEFAKYVSDVIDSEDKAFDGKIDEFFRDKEEL